MRAFSSALAVLVLCTGAGCAGQPEQAPAKQPSADGAKLKAAAPADANSKLPAPDTKSEKTAEKEAQAKETAEKPAKPPGARAPVSYTFEAAPVMSYLSFAPRGGAALMTLPLGATFQFLSTEGATWFSFHASIFSPGVNWTGIKNPTPFYPSVLGAATTGVQVHWQPQTAEDENGSFAIELSFATVATGEALGGDASRSLTAGVLTAITWTPGRDGKK